MYATYCNPCQNRISAASHKKTNNTSLEKAKKHLEEWTPSQVKELWFLVDRGLSTRQIGERLGRTEVAISNARYRYARERESDIYLCYLNSSGVVRIVGSAYKADSKGSRTRLNRVAQDLAALHPQLIFFVTTEDESSAHWKEVVGWESEVSTL